MSTMPPPPPPPSSMPPGYQPYPTGAASGMNYASWGARVGGAILNGLVGALFGLPANIASASDVQVGALLSVVSTVIYYVLYSKAVGKTGQFWGHRGAGVRIVDANTGAPIGAGKAFGRALLHILDAIPCGLGFLWPLWDKKHQTFADKIVGTVSVRA